MQWARFLSRLAASALVLIGLAFGLSSIDIEDFTGKSTPSPSSTILGNIPEAAQERASVVRVVDGDTIRVMLGSEEKVVRLIGINTPETVAPQKPDECFGAEASQYVTTLLTGQTVAMASDESQQDMDRYGRLLRYMYLADGLFVNEKLVRDGYAAEYTYDRPYEFQQRFKQVQKEAQHAGLGLWAACAATPAIEE